MACEDPACADLLLAAGADLDAVNEMGVNALTIATWELRDEMVQWLRAQYAARGRAPPDVPPNADADEDEDAGLWGVAEDDGEAVPVAE
jgi:hypothetical protein